MGKLLAAMIAATVPLVLIGCSSSSDDSTATEQGIAGSGGADSDKVEICHVPPGNPAAAHTIVVGAAAVDAHLRHGDTRGACGTTTGVCPCQVPTIWRLDDVGGLSCFATVSGGRLSVCTPSGAPTCAAYAGDGSLLPLADCAACLTVQLPGSIVIASCADVPAHLP
jgi:hypothetical protein